MKHAIAIRHVHFEDLGSLAEILTENDFKIQYLEAGIDDLSSIDPLQADLLIILGAPIGVYETDNYPFLKDEIALLQARLTNDLPTLGICLGAQLMAAALGAKVYPGKFKEIGWSPLTLKPIAKENYFTHLAAKKTSVLHWHGDTFDLPHNANLLASTELYANQAFSYGNNALALQFHPEVLPEKMEHWYIGHAVELARTQSMTIKQLRQDTQKLGSQLTKQAKLFWQGWLQTIFII